MKRATTAILITLLAVPAVALAAVDKFKGGGTQDTRTTVKFDVVRAKDKVQHFQAEKVRYTCNKRDTFRANPPEFPRDIEADSKGNFDDDYSLTDEDNNVKIKFKGKVDGKLLHVQRKKDGKNRSDDRSKGRWNKAKGTMQFHARYKSDGDRCQSRTLDWKAKLV
jgi:hypothetical protein